MNKSLKALALYTHTHTQVNLIDKTNGVKAFLIMLKNER